MYRRLLCLSFISILICSTCANDEQPILDDYNQMINNFDQISSSLANSTQNQNVIDLLQTIQLNSTQQASTSKNITGLSNNFTTSGIPTLYNTYQYDSPVYSEVRTKDQTQSTLLDSSDTNHNYYAKEYSGFDDNQKMFIEQQIEQDSKYYPEFFDVPPAISTQIIEQQPPSIDSNLNQVNQEYGTKLNKINKSVQNSFKTPVVANNNRLNRLHSTKGTINSIRMANNQEWNPVPVDKNQQGLIDAGQLGLAGLKSNSHNNLQQSSLSDDASFTSLDQQYDISNVNKITNQPNYNRPEDSVQIITANNQPVQQQILASYPIKQQTIAQQYNPSPVIQQTITYPHRKPPCIKVNQNYEASRQRPFYFGWKQRQPQKSTTNQGMNYVQRPNYQANHNYQTKYFGMPNSFDQPQLNKVRKCCIIKLVPKPAGFNKAQSQFASASAMQQSNPFQNNLPGMFGIGVNSVVNKIENKKRKVKNLIKAPFVFVNGMKNKALSSSNQYRPNFNPNFNPNYKPSYNQPNYVQPNYIQQQNTFQATKSYNPDSGY